MARRVTRAQQRARAEQRAHEAKAPQKKRPPKRRPATEAPPPAAPSVPAPLTPLQRADAGWAAGTAALAAALFATVLTSHPGLGDAPETVAGIDSFGILHAPGYPAYTLAARLFTLLEPFGGIAFRVNLFSLVCASLTIAGVYLLARRCGAARWASSVAALCLAAGAGFWFDAGFAKHNAFSGLVLLITIHLTLACLDRPSRLRLLGVGAALGVGLGGSWPLTLLLLPTVALVLIMKRRALSLRALAPAAAVGLAVTAALYGFVMVRAAQDPPVNWGRATTPARLASLVSRADFSGKRSTRAALPASRPRRQGVAAAPVTTYAATFWLELGTAGIALAAWGLFVGLRRRRTVASYPLVVTFVAGLVGASLTVGASGSSYDLNLLEHGFLFGCYFPMAAWLAVGATDVVSRLGSPSWVEQLGRHVQRLQVLAAAFVAACVLIPSAVAHWPAAHRSDEPLADRYARSVFRELPRRSILFVGGAERAQPLIYRQLVHHERTDVLVVAADGLAYDWYREQLARRLGRPLPRRVGNSLADAQRTVKSLRGIRPIFFDMTTAQSLQDRIGYRPVGLLAEMSPGHGLAGVTSPEALDARLRKAEDIAGIPSGVWMKWPARLVGVSYATAALEVARAYYARRDVNGMRGALEQVLSIDPGNKAARSDLELLARNPTLAPAPPGP